MNTFLAVALVLEGLVAVSFVLAPRLALGPLATSVDASAIPLAQLFGSAIVGLCVAIWSARRSPDPAMKRVAVASVAAYYVVSALALIPAQLSGLLSPLGWGAIGGHLALAAWAGWLLATGKS